MTKFEELNSKINRRVRADYTYELTADQAIQIDPRLGVVVKKLPDQILKMNSVKLEQPEPNRISTVKGNIIAATKSMPVPGMGGLEAEFEGATATIRTTYQEEGHVEIDPEIEIEIVAESKLDETLLDVTWTLTEESDQKIILGKRDKAIGADFVKLAERTDWSDFVNELLHVADLIKLRGAAFHDATLVVDPDKEETAAKVRGIGMKGSLTFGPVELALDLLASRGGDGKFSKETFEVAASIGAAKKKFNLGAILNDLAGFAFWPSWLDPDLDSLSLGRVFVPKDERIDEDNDRQRIVVQSPARKSKDDTPSLLVTIAKDSMNERVVALRLGWPRLDVYNMPVVGDHLPISFAPLLTIATTHPLSIERISWLCALDQFPGLETMGAPLGKIKDETIRKGIHCTGILKMGTMLDAAFHFPIKQGKDDQPFDPARLDDPESATPVPVQKKTKAIRLDGAGFKSKDEWTTIILKVVVEAKGLILAPIGLGISYTFKDPGPGNDRVKVVIDGAALSYQNGGLMVSGGLIRDTTQEGPNDWFGTGLLMYGTAFSFGAAFAFRDAEEKQLFLFAYARRTLGGPPAFYVTGIAAAIGYNRSFIVPPVDQVNEFPLMDIARRLAAGEKNPVKEKMDANGLMRMAEDLKKYIPPSPGMFFGTAGVSFTTSGFMNSIVLITVSAGSSLEFSLLGTSIIDLPRKRPGAQDDTPPITHIELQVVGALRTKDGFFGLDAVLGPNSYVFAKNCRLTGGFAVRYWFGGKRKNDFVVSLGGFHPAYLKPDHYPNVPRLGFQWKKSSTTSITGFAYLAVTPKNFQLGGGLNMQYQLDPVRAWLHVEAHFLISWDPFFYDVRLDVDMGVSIRMDLLFCSVTLAVEISAKLHLWGPEFSGHAEVRLWFASIGVDFGAGAAQEAPKLEWNKFVSAFITPIPPKPEEKPSELVLADPEAPPLPIDIVPLSGTMPAKQVLVAATGNQDAPVIDWLADPQTIALKISTTIPAIFASVNQEALSKVSGTIHARPVIGAPQIDPELQVTVTRFAPKLHAEAAFPVEWQAPETQVQSALWGADVKTGEDVSGGNETLPGITFVTLGPKIYEAGESLSIPVEVLLYHIIDTKPCSWHAVDIPAKTFSWDRDNPYQTIEKPEVVARRRKMLDSLAAAGVLDRDADKQIDLKNLKQQMPCFMLNPVLCSLGAATNAA